ncbi:class I SAM-dependent methyltransferase [Thermomonospora echinospora]|nr:methyltransferase domain-containing protein [Thermomonospora echinospora]
MTTDHTGVDELREAAIAELRSAGTLASQEVEAAFRAVPRHTFIPEADLATAWAPYRAVVTKRDEHGNALSSVSDMHVQSYMLTEARIEPGMNVLEIGSGGYNAALIAELVGPDGRVTTVDIDEWVTDRASRLLDAAGYSSRVEVVLADAEAGMPDGAPYDRILVTVGSWDIPPAWTEQLADDGLLVVPLEPGRSAAPCHTRSRPATRPPCGFGPELVHQLPQRLLAPSHRREHHVADLLVGAAKAVSAMGAGCSPSRLSCLSEIVIARRCRGPGLLGRWHRCGWAESDVPRGAPALLEAGGGAFASTREYALSAEGRRRVPTPGTGLGVCAEARCAAHVSLGIGGKSRRRRA